MSEHFPDDVNPVETRDRLQAIESVIHEEGVERAWYLVDRLPTEAHKGGVSVTVSTDVSNYINAVPAKEQPEHSGNLKSRRRIRSVIR